MISTCFMAGILVGAVGSGYLSDKYVSPLQASHLFDLTYDIASYISSLRYGRKKTIYGSIILKLLATYAAAFPINYPWVAVTRFLLGVGSTGAYLTGFILLMELIGGSWRGALGVSYQLQFAIGFMLWPGVAFFIRDDVILQLVVGIPLIILLLFWW